MDASRGSTSNIFPMQQIPFASPRPPAMALSSSSSLSLSSLRDHAHSHAPSAITSFPILLLTVLGILAASLILLAYYVFVIRCCLTWHRHRGSTSGGASGVAGLIVSRRPQRNTSATMDTSDDAEPTRGLEDAAIRALPAFSYRKTTKPANAASETEPSAPASECAVCLGEFEEGDTVRMLPACLHVFHLGCVDAWLQGNTSCPLCRADVAATLCRLLPSPLEEEEVVAIQVVVVPSGAEEDGHDTLAQQRAANVAPAPVAEIQGEADHHLVVGGDKTKTTVDGCVATA